MAKLKEGELYRGKCPVCGMMLKVTYRRDSTVACPNREGRCGTFWRDANGMERWLPTELCVK